MMYATLKYSGGHIRKTWALRAIELRRRKSALEVGANVGRILEPYGESHQSLDDAGGFDGRIPRSEIYRTSDGHITIAMTPCPVLADALEDAGCTNADLLAHCRGPGPHVRGCWAVDLILGKS